jgi:hypothetical protein
MLARRFDHDQIVSRYNSTLESMTDLKSGVRVEDWEQVCRDMTDLLDWETWHGIADEIDPQGAAKRHGDQAGTSTLQVGPAAERTKGLAVGDVTP